MTDLTTCTVAVDLTPHAHHQKVTCMIIVIMCTLPDISPCRGPSQCYDCIAVGWDVAADDGASVSAPDSSVLAQSSACAHTDLIAEEPCGSHGAGRIAAGLRPPSLSDFIIREPEEEAARQEFDLVCAVITSLHLG